MSNTLATKICKPCHQGSQSLSDANQVDYLSSLEGWEVLKVEGVDRINKSYTFNNFVDALTFTNAIGDIAEAEDHHPKLTTEWGKVTVSWWTHTISGLHHNDFIMAARTDQVFEKQ